MIVTLLINIILLQQYNILLWCCAALLRVRCVGVGVATRLGWLLACEPRYRSYQINKWVIGAPAIRPLVTQHHYKL
jgi:hypothetical protein